MGKENPITRFLRQLRQSASAKVVTRELQRQQAFDYPEEVLFAMGSNGFVPRGNNLWQFDARHAESTKRFQSTHSVIGYPFIGAMPEARLAEAFAKPSVSATIRQHREYSEDSAAKISYVMGGIAYAKGVVERSEPEKTIDAMAEMTALGRGESAEAIADAIARYVICSNSLEYDGHFKNNVREMAEAITDEPFVPQETQDLGILQALRLRRFISKFQSKVGGGVKHIVSPEIEEFTSDFVDFPTIGAEFHMRLDTERFERFWQRLALLNMSQYLRGLWIPLSRKEGNIIEIRMNPSIFPVAVATWDMMRFLLPELNSSYFTTTMNWKNSNFDAANAEHTALITCLRTLGSLWYAAYKQDAPQFEAPHASYVLEGGMKPLPFGEIYVGQTTKIENGFPKVMGDTAKKEGQLNIYGGYGDMFEPLAYFFSMAMTKPAILGPVWRHIDRVATPQEALEVSDEEIRFTFEVLQSSIDQDPRLARAIQSGQRIIDQLTP